MVVLPAIGNSKPVRDEIEFLEKQGVDPSALYYTDLEIMAKIQTSISDIHKQHPKAFWHASWNQSEN